MRTTGSFTTTTKVAGLRSMSVTPDLLERTRTLSDVSTVREGVLRAVFMPITPLGRIPLATTIETMRESDDGAHLRVRGRRGVQTVDVDLVLTFVTDGAMTTVGWEADVVVRGNLASVGQRVAGEVATRAINEVLADAAAVAGTATSGADR